MDFDLNLTGFSADEHLRLLEPPNSERLPTPGPIPSPPADASPHPAALWLLGRPRLLCLDSAKAEDVDPLLEGPATQLVNPAPPYNVKVEPRSNNAIAAGLSSFQGA